MAAESHSITPHFPPRVAMVPAVVLTTLVLSPSLAARLAFGLLGLIQLIAWLRGYQREREAMARTVANTVSQACFRLFKQALVDPHAIEALLDETKEQQQMSVATRRETLPGAYLTGSELYRLACDYLGFSWRLVDGGVAVLHRGELVRIAASVQEARHTIVEITIGMLKDAPAG